MKKIQIVTAILMCCILVSSGCAISPRTKEEVFRKQPSEKEVFNTENIPSQNAPENEQSQQHETPIPDKKEPDEPMDSANTSKTSPVEAPSAQVQKGLIEYEDYTGEIPHLFTHCLIAYPQYKTRDGYMRYDSDCITVTEFKRILKQLYKNGYSLINLKDAYYQDKSGAVKLTKSVKVPKGRKPFILSIDDMVYDSDKRGNGMVDFLALDEDNRITAGTYEMDGTVSYSYDNECIPILEEFINKHPDFSSRGARMTLCMTGFTGQFGYRTDHHYKGSTELEKAKAIELADRLRELGYTFASHSYGHYDISSLTPSQLEDELRLFEEEVVPIIGRTDIFIYPYGKLITPDDKKYKILLDYGFRVFCSVSHFFFRRDYDEGHSIYMTRVSLDGYSLRNYKSVLKPLFDADMVLDRKNRP